MLKVLKSNQNQNGIRTPIYLNIEWSQLADAIYREVSRSADAVECLRITK